MATYDELSRRLSSFDKAELGSGVDDALIAAAEDALGVPIRGGFRRFLSDFGWGAVGHHELLGIGGSPYHDLLRITMSERTEMQPSLPGHLLPIKADGAGNHHCIDTATGDEPSIVFWDHELGAGQVPWDAGADFASWLWELMDSLE